MNLTKSDQLPQMPLGQLTRASLIIRFTVIAIVIGGIAVLFAYAGGWLTPHALTPASMINTFQKVFGLHPGFRRNHAKGVCVSGYFESNGQGELVSRASAFVRGRYPVVGRLSMPGTDPRENDSNGAIRSFALRIALPRGEDWRLAMNSVP